MRHACLYKGLCSSLREARRDEDEAERGDAARLQQLLERGHTNEVRIPAPILHREVVWVAVARVVESATLAERHEGSQPIGRRVLEAHLEIAPRLAHGVADELALLVEIEHVHRHHLPAWILAYEWRRKEHSEHGHLPAAGATGTGCGGAQTHVAPPRVPFAHPASGSSAPTATAARRAGGWRVGAQM